MTVEVFTFCWNEMAILPFAVDYWSKYASHVTVYDNGSNDGSVQYLQAQGDWITVNHFDTDGKINDTQLRMFKNNVWKQARGRADLVVVSDMDEMLCAPDIVQSLSTMRRVGGTVCYPHWYNLVSDEVPVFNGQPLHKIRPLGVAVMARARFTSYTPITACLSTTRCPDTRKCVKGCRTSTRRTVMASTIRSPKTF